MTIWMIESAESPESKPKFFGLGRMSQHNIGGVDRVITFQMWDEDPVEAMQFGKQESAELYVHAHLHLGPNLRATESLVRICEYEVAYGGLGGPRYTRPNWP